MSERTSTRASVNCSGLAKAGVPTNPPCVKPIASGFSTSALATPKSITFTTISGASAWPDFGASASESAATSIRFAGFKSRCTKPCFSAAVSALLTCKAISIVVSASRAQSGEHASPAFRLPPVPSRRSTARSLRGCQNGKRSQHLDAATLPPSVLRA